MTELTPKQQARADGLLDAAEALFASYGFHAVSVRDITGLAKVRLAAVNDLFGGKEKLFYEVIKRRAEVVNALREERLAAIDDAKPRENRLQRSFQLSLTLCWKSASAVRVGVITSDWSIR